MGRRLRDRHHLHDRLLSPAVAGDDDAGLPAGRRRLADARARRSGELSGTGLRPGVRCAGPGGEQSALEGHRDRLQPRAYCRGAQPGRRKPPSTTSPSSRPTCPRWPRMPAQRRCRRRISSACTECGAGCRLPCRRASSVCCGRKVKPGGAVHVSYNSLPAWGAALGMQRILRECGLRLAARSDRQAEEGLKVVKDLWAADAPQLITIALGEFADRAPGRHAEPVPGARVHERQPGRRASTATCPAPSPGPSSNGSGRSA